MYSVNMTDALNNKKIRESLKNESEYCRQCSGSGQEQVAGCCKCGDEPSGSVKCGKFLD